MTRPQVQSARDTLHKFAASGWFGKVMGPKQQSAVRVGIWALDMVLQAMARDA